MSEDTPPRIAPFNPLDKKNLGESVAGAMLHQPVGNLPPEAFIGAGIYAIYYIGDFGVYRQVSELTSTIDFLGQSTSGKQFRRERGRAASAWALTLSKYYFGDWSSTLHPSNKRKI